MNKYVVAICLVMLALSTSCSGITGTTVVVTPTPATTTPVLPYNTPPIEQPWISPGKVQVSNFYPGARAEYYLTVHNGYQSGYDEYIVITEAGEHSIAIALKKQLREGKLSNVLGISTSDSGDKCVVTSYNVSTNKITIEGLKESTKRTLAIAYEHESPSEYSVYYRVPDNTAEGYERAPAAAQGCVIIADPTPVLMPYETRDILVAVELPSNAVVPKKWEFWIGVKDTTQGGFVAVEVACRWLLTMR